jgi:hypothetical protein
MPGPAPSPGYEVGIRESTEKRGPVFRCMEVAGYAKESEELVGVVDECKSFELVEPGENNLVIHRLGEKGGSRLGLDEWKLGRDEFAYIEGEV